MPGNCDQVCMQHLNGQVALGVPLEFSLSVHWSAGHIPTTIKWRPIREVWTSAKPKPARPVKRQLEGLGGLEGIWIDLVWTRSRQVFRRVRNVWIEVIAV